MNSILIDGFACWNKGAIRLYDCSDRRTPQEHYDDKDDYLTVINISKIRDQLVLMDASVSTVPLTRKVIRRLAAILLSEGFLYAVSERAAGRRMPFATLIEDGDLAGMWRQDLAAIVAGADGSY